MPLRIIFMGTPEFSIPTLVELVGQGHEVIAVYSQPPRPAGRGMDEQKSAVHKQAEELGIAVYTPHSLRDLQEQRRFAELHANVAVVVAYGLILPPEILDAPEYGCYNGHASLLPRWRGAAPIQRAIMAGDTQTGTMIMKMDQGLDTGPVALAERVGIDENMTAGELHDKLAVMTGDLMGRAVGALERGSLELQPQSGEGVTYAHKITKNETRIDWSKPAREVHNHIRSLSPFPGAWCEFEISGKPTRVKILHSQLAEGSGVAGTVLDNNLAIACGENSVALLRLQRSGKQAQDAVKFLRGNPLSAGSRLG